MSENETRSKRKHLFMWILIGVGILLVAMSLIASTIVLKDIDRSSSQGVRAQVNVTEETLPQYLSFNQAVQDLPLDAAITLKTSEKEYKVTKGYVSEGHINNPDITITLPSSYIPKLSNGFCATLSQAYNNGDLSFQLHTSKVSAGWKYRALYKYRDCLGI